VALEATWGRALTESLSAVRFFLSRAANPKVYANGRWTAVNAATRKAFAVTGKDYGCPLLHFLARGSRIESEASNIAGAIAALGVGDKISGTGYLGWYRTLNHNYPFLDYSKHSSFQSDADLMKAYAAEAPAPSLVTARKGDRYKLPDGHIGKGSHASPQQPTPELIAAWLKIAAGIARVDQLTHSLAAHKTSPSGGARHPTDIGISASENWGTISGCSWWYDQLAHELVKSDAPLPTVRTSPAIVFSITSHVRRAMWRYRDARAYRPVVIDAGHVVETLLAAISYSGWQGWWQPEPGVIIADGDLDPVFGYVVATLPSQPGHKLIIDETRIHSEANEDEYLTNPTLSLFVAGGSVRAEVLYPKTSAPMQCTPEIIDAFAYATPSSRSDRPTRRADLIHRFLSNSQIDSLVAQGFFLPATNARDLWSQISVWSDHNWYLSLLAHCAEAAKSEKNYPTQVAPVNFPALPVALDHRRTSRKLQRANLPSDIQKALMHSLADVGRHLRIFISAWVDVGSLKPGTYEVISSSLVLMTETLPTDSELTTAAIGQPWACGFGCVVWLVPTPSTSAGSWIESYLECGRIAQRVALSLCHDTNVGVFQSPALVDDKFPKLAPDLSNADGAYFIGIGRSESISLQRAESNFIPSQLFRGA
jgi:hypothetical protein